MSSGMPGEPPIPEFAQWHKRFGSARNLIIHRWESINLTLWCEHGVPWGATRPVTPTPNSVYSVGPWPPASLPGESSAQIRSKPSMRGQPEWRDFLQNDGDIYVTYWEHGHDANGCIRGEELMRARAAETPGLDGTDDKGGYHPSRQASNAGKGRNDWPYERRDRWGRR